MHTFKGKDLKKAHRFRPDFRLNKIKSMNHSSEWFSYSQLP